jgi:hypothetical protein
VQATYFEAPSSLPRSCPLAAIPLTFQLADSSRLLFIFSLALFERGDVLLGASRVKQRPGA